MGRRLLIFLLIAETFVWAREHEIVFKEISVPKTDKQKREVRASKSVVIDGKKYDIDYHVIARSGDRIGEGIFGLLYDKSGKPLRYKNGKLKIANSNDFTSLIPFKDKVFMINHFESRPAAAYITEIEVEKDGNLRAVNTKPIDFSSYNGLWSPCAGSITPWNTHLGGEEYEPNARNLKKNGSINFSYDMMAEYVNGDLKALNPYDYGWITEIKIVNSNGDTDVKKHYCMGRFSHELGFVMPDKRTVFLSDDGTNVALFMFIADREGDLSSGILYAAKWIQKSDKNAGEAKLEWINLGHADDKEIKKALDKRIKFYDLFEVSNTEKRGFKSINTMFGEEILKLKRGMDKIASRLESRRYAALKGATSEFRKMEGITYNPDQNVLYISMSNIDRGMEDNKKEGVKNSYYDKGGNNDIRLNYNPCGSVYELTFHKKKTYDSDGKEINSSFVPDFMKGLIWGVADRSVEGNECSINSIANPDNITFIPNSSTLLIGEDSSVGHQNDYVWAYNVKNRKLTRIETTPYGSEATSIYYIKNIKNHGYIMSVVQHPYTEGDAVYSSQKMPSLAKSKEERRAYTGYIGPLPVIE